MLEYYSGRCTEQGMPLRPGKKKLNDTCDDCNSFPVFFILHDFCSSKGLMDTAHVDDIFVHWT